LRNRIKLRCLTEDFGSTEAADVEGVTSDLKGVWCKIGRTGSTNRCVCVAVNGNACGSGMFRCSTLSDEGGESEGRDDDDGGGGDGSGSDVRDERGGSSETKAGAGAGLCCTRT
jgi:hypothetical protein